MDRSLVAYAFLAQASRGTADLLSGLAPLFKPIAKTHAGKKFDGAEFSRLVGQLYGIKVNAWAVQEFAPRLAEAGVLQKVQVSAGVHEYFYAPIQEEFSEVTEGDVTSIVDAFKEFAAPLLKEHRITLADDELERALFRQLVDLNFIAILIKPEQDTSKKGTRTLSMPKPPAQVAAAKETEEQARLDVLCASFILDVRRRKPSLYDLLVRIVTGALIAEVVLDFQEPQYKGGLENLIVVLDAPFLMALLDVSSEEAHEVAVSVCTELTDRKVRLATFEHCLQELKENLGSVRTNVHSGGGYGPTARRLSGTTFHAYVNALIQDPSAALRTRNLKILPTLESDGAYQYFTGEMESSLEGAFGTYWNNLARQRDAASIATVMRLRRGITTRMADFGRAGYVFVTQNARVVESAKRFMVRSKLLGERDVPPAITDRYLAGLLWVMFGGRASEITPKLLLANCAAAVEPRSDVVTKMHQFLSDMSPGQADLFRALMTDERAGQHLMEITLGDSSYLNAENVADVLEKVRSKVGEEVELRAEAEKQEIHADHQAELRGRGAIEEALRQDLANVQARAKIEAERSAHLEATLRLEQQRLRNRIAQEREDIRQRVETAAHEVIVLRKGLNFVGALLTTGIAAFIAWISANSQSPRVLWVTVLLTSAATFVGSQYVSNRFIEPHLGRWQRRSLDRKVRKQGIHNYDDDFDVDFGTGIVATRSKSLTVGPKASGT